MGRLAVVRVQDGDTLPDIARHFGLGYDEISAANPGVDVWAPQAGSPVLLPLMFILPESPRKGIVVNLAAMRMFQYRGKKGPLVTYPVGIGEEGRATPLGEMSVERKAVRPTWHVPASIRRDHQKRGDPLPAEVPPGPDNPLGEYALYLSRASLRDPWDQQTIQYRSASDERLHPSLSGRHPEIVSGRTGQDGGAHRKPALPDRPRGRDALPGSPFASGRTECRGDEERNSTRG